MRLEFFKVEEKELKDFLNSWVKGEDVSESYADRDGNQKTKLRVSKNRMYLGNNLSLRINQDETSKAYYISLEYFSADDRIKFNSPKVEKTDVF